MDWLLFIAGLIGVTRPDNSPGQQSIASAALGVGLFRLTNRVPPGSKGS